MQKVNDKKILNVLYYQTPSSLQFHMKLFFFNLVLFMNLMMVLFQCEVTLIEPAVFVHSI